jgi:hypothetical protein
MASWTLIRHRDRHGHLEYVSALCSRPNLECDFAAIWGELDRIGKEIEQNLLHLTLIGVQQRDVVGHIQFELNVAIPGESLSVVI